MSSIHHNVARADCREFHCGADTHVDEHDPFQPFRAVVLIEHLLDPTVWVTNDGEAVAFNEMTDRHLANAIRFMRRTRDQQITKYQSMWLRVPFPMFNGDQAQLLAESMWEQTTDKLQSASRLEDLPHFRALVREYTRRLIQRRRVRSTCGLVPASW